MEVPNAATEKELKEVVIDIDMEYSVCDSTSKALLKPSSILPLPVEVSDPY